MVYIAKGDGTGLLPFVDETPNLQGTSEAAVHPDGNSRNVLEIISPSDASPFIILQGWGSYNWASRDMGTTWIQPCEIPGSDKENCFASPVGNTGSRMSSLFKINPEFPEYVLAMTLRRSCMNADAATGELCGEDLMHSSDFGKTWVNLTTLSDSRIAGFVDFDWAPVAPGTQLDGPEDHPGILATVYESNQDMIDGLQKSWDYNVHFVWSHDLFKTEHNRVLMCGNSFEVLNGDIYVAQLRDCEKYHQSSAEDKANADTFPGTEIALRVSNDRGGSFAETCFPVSLAEKGYTIFDYREDVGGPDFISVNHDEEDPVESRAPMGNLYSSDKTLQLFSLSMRRNVRFGGSAVDFINVEGIHGIYIANQIDGGAFSDPSVVSGRGRVEDFVHTRITYNGGGSWQSITPPLTDSEGKPIRCHAVGNGRCELHLHGESHWQQGSWKTRLGSVYSQKSAPGVILATGNVGQYLSADANLVNTYLSRDAGSTWEEILKGPHIYEFGNHGGLIVAAQLASAGPTDEVWFTRDEGACWEGPIKLSNKMSVHNIRVAPDSIGDVFIIHGTDSEERDGDPDGVMYILDFNRLTVLDPKNNMQASAFTFPVCSDSDYETWSPNPPGAPGKCILGQKYSLARRKRDVRCLNEPDYEKKHDEATKCPCDAQYDTECQYGSERVDGLGDCVKMDDIDVGRCAVLECVEIPSSNLRAIAGTQCEGDMGDMDPDLGQIRQVGCDAKKSGGGHPILTFFIVMFFIVLALGGAWYAHMKYDLSTFVPERVKDAFEGILEKIRELTGRSSRPAGYFEPLGDFDGDEI